MSADHYAELADQYINHQRALGFKLQVEGGQVRDFAAYADRSGHKGPITTELALTWAQLPEDASPLYRARRLEVVRCFARYAAIFDPDTEIPPKGILGKAHRRAQPHIFSETEVSELMQAAGNLTPRDGLRPRTYVALFGLLSSTGLRISEALSLRRCDADLREGILTIRESKYHKTRLVVLHPSVTKALQEYDTFRSDYHPQPVDSTFLLSEKGAALAYSTVRNTFRFICDRLGWTACGTRPRPRIYDLRHTFACRRLTQWYRDGVDTAYALNWLSTYLGHRKIADTYWYLTGVPELLEIAATRFEEYVSTHQREER
jgi:integrase